jgi:hypothetical protein
MTDREAIDVLFNEWKCIDRNDGIHCDRKCESCDLVMDVGIIREAFNMAISALQAQEAKHSTESSLTQKALDTISRQAAIDALCSECQGRCIPCENYPCGEVEAINALPSAQPEIIRCKDCRHYEWTSNRVPEEQTWYCYKWNAETGKDDYCSYAERKE